MTYTLASEAMQTLSTFLNLIAISATLISLPLSIFLYGKAIKFQFMYNQELINSEKDKVYRSLKISRFERLIEKFSHISKYEIEDFDSQDARSNILYAVLYSDGNIANKLANALIVGYFVDNRYLERWKSDLIADLRASAAAL